MGDCAAPQSAAMTTPAAVFGPSVSSHVLRMVELHIEAFLKLIRKDFARRIVPVHVLMTDRAHRNIRRRELRQMTAGAGFVTGKTRTRRIVRSVMAVVATD